MQTHIISTACFRGLRVFEGSTGHYYSPHSGRNFLPSAASVLGFSKSERDFLGGWSAEGSQWYTRTAKYKIAQMQTAVAGTFRSLEPDQLAEADDIDSLADSCGVGIFRKTPVVSLRKSYVCDRTQTSRGPTPLNLFLLIVILFQVSWLWTIMTKLRNCRTNCQKKSSNRVTEADQSFLGRITNRLVQNFGLSYGKVTTYRTRARRPFGLCTVWDVATCCLESIIHLSHTLVCSSQPPMSMTLCASGVQKLKNQRRIQSLQVQTLRRPPTSEITL